MDFKPKTCTKNDHQTFIQDQEINKLKHNKHQPSLSELGIDDLNNPIFVPVHIQRETALKKQIRTRSSESPNMTAHVLKAWLNEKS